MDNFPFALRTLWPRQSNAIHQALEALEAQKIPVADLTVSNPTICGFAYPPQLLEALTAPENLKYQPEAFGLSSARRAVARHYRRQGLLLGPQQILLTASTSEAYAYLLRLLVNPGEKVLVPRPSYPLFQYLLDIHDVKYEYYPLTYEGQWHLDIKALEALIDAKTRALVLVNPNNPTGSFIRRGELSHINALCAKHRMAIISDEVFADYGFEASDAVSCAGNQAALTFVLGGLSKSLGLPQMKCAWILSSGPEGPLKEALLRLEIIADSFLSVNTPVQNALNTWLEQDPPMQGQIKQRVQKNLQWLSRQNHKHAELLNVQGGWYAILRLPAVKTEEEWVLELLRQEHVLVYPGYFFDFEDGAHIIFSLLPREKDFQEALGRVFQRLAKSCN